MSPTITAARREEPKTSLATGPDRAAVPRRIAFWLLALVFAVTMLGTTLPTPLYDIYQAQWHFSAAIVTVTFAVYAAWGSAHPAATGRAGPGWPQAGAGRGPGLQRAEHGGVHPGPQRGGADDRPDPVRVLGGPDDRHGDGAMLTELIPASGQPPGLAGGHGGEHGRPRPGPADRRALRPVRPPSLMVLVFEVYLAVLAVAGLGACSWFRKR